MKIQDHKKTIFDTCSTGDLCIVCRQKIKNKTFTLYALPIRQSFAVHDNCCGSFSAAIDQINRIADEVEKTDTYNISQLALSICRAITLRVDPQWIVTDK